MQARPLRKTETRAPLRKGRSCASEGISQSHSTRNRVIHLDTRHAVIRHPQPVHRPPLEDAEMHNSIPIGSCKLVLVDCKAGHAADGRELMHVERSEGGKGMEGEDALCTLSCGQSQD